MARCMEPMLLFLISMVCLIPKSSSAKPAKEKMYYVDLERINLTYYSQKYLRNPKITSQRINRSDPVHYISFQAETLAPIGNNVLLDGYVYEFLSNEYRPSFVEVHFKLCDMMHHEGFGPLVTTFLPFKKCPVPEGIYDQRNIHLPELPFLSTFPFQKGRVFVNTTITGSGGVRERLFSLYTDAVIKQR